MVPAGVSVCVCVPSAEPVNVSAGTVPPLPLNVGTPAGQATVPAGVKAAVPFVPAGVKLAVPFVPVAVKVCVCVASAEPVNVSAGTINELPGDTPPMVENAPALVPALLPVTVATVTVPFVPAGVPAETALVVAELPVKVSAGTVPAEPVKVSAGTVPALPANVGTPTGHATVPEGVKAAVPFVPAGVPPLTAEVVWFDVPVNVGAATVPAGV